MNGLLIISLFIGSASAVPQILQLSNYVQGGEFILNGVDTDAKVYLASNDDYSALRKIQIRSGKNTTSLDQLADFNQDGTAKYFNATNGLILQTFNNDTITKLLSGYLYLTSRNQAKDSSFAVYVVKDRSVVSRSEGKSTTVILNVRYNASYTEYDEPLKTSYVTGIQQSSNTNIYFQYGFPATNWLEVTNNTFFTNSALIKNYDDKGNYLNTKQVFFDNIEPLQINLDCWYLLAFGPVNMVLENKYVSAHNYTTTATNTTGLLMNNNFYLNHMVNFLSDDSHSRTTGYMLSSFLRDNITFSLESDTTSSTHTFDSSVDYYDSMKGQVKRLVVNTTALLPGTFYCQYFAYSGDLLPVTIPPKYPATTIPTSPKSTTTTTVATTTSSVPARNMFELLAVVILMMFV